MPTWPRPIASHDSPGSSPSACALSGSALSSPPASPEPPAASVSASRPSELARGHERDVGFVSARETGKIPRSLSAPSRCAKLRRVDVDVRERVGRRGGEQPGVAAGVRERAGAVGRFDHVAQPRFAADDREAVDQPEGDAAGVDLVGDAVVAGGVRARLGGLRVEERARLGAVAGVEHDRALGAAELPNANTPELERRRAGPASAARAGCRRRRRGR